MRLRVALLVSAVVAVAAPAANAATIQLGWNEVAESRGKPIMRFSVSSLTLANGRWSVRASFSNESSVALRVQNRFALAMYTSTHAYSEFRPFKATTFKPRLPSSLAPGARWSGTFGGNGRPLRGVYLRVYFGRFIGRPSPLPDFPRGFAWITDHYYSYR